MFILIFLSHLLSHLGGFSYAFRGKPNLDKRGKMHLDNDNKSSIRGLFACNIET